MKLVTFRAGSEDRLGVMLGDEVLDAYAAAQEPALRSMLALIEGGEAALRALSQVVTAASGRHLHKCSEIRLRAPLPLPQQFRDSMCFHQHIRQGAIAVARRLARESGSVEKVAAAETYAAKYQLPEIYRRQPVYYKGNRFNVADPDEDIPWPAYSKLMDFELELAAIIGRRGKDIPPERALDYVFGFTIFNDFSARDAQALEMQGMLGPAKGKDFDKANVFGPCVATTDEIGDPQNLRMTARVNGETWCEGSSATMNWSFADLIAHISRGETLYPGEIIASGTVGNGCGLEHDRFLASGDVVELEIEKIGVLRNRVIRL